MGIKRKLSRLWKETRDGILRGPGVDVDSVKAGQASITGETLIKSRIPGDNPSVSANSWINIIGETIRDNRLEVNNSFQIVPDKTGEYDISMAVMFTEGGDGDQCRLRVREVSTSTTVNAPVQQDIDASDFGVIVWCETIELTAGESYELQASNEDSSCEVQGGGSTRAVVKWSPVQP